MLERQLDCVYKKKKNVFIIGDYNSNVLRNRPGGGGGVLPHMGYIGMCGPKGYGFSAVLVINRVSNFADSGNK